MNEVAEKGQNRPWPVEVLLKLGRQVQEELDALDRIGQELSERIGRYLSYDMDALIHMFASEQFRKTLPKSGLYERHEKWLILRMALLLMVKGLFNAAQDDHDEHKKMISKIFSILISVIVILIMKAE